MYATLKKLDRGFNKLINNLSDFTPALFEVLGWIGILAALKFVAANEPILILIGEIVKLFLLVNLYTRAGNSVMNSLIWPHFAAEAGHRGTRRPLVGVVLAIPTFVVSYFFISYLVDLLSVALQQTL